MATTVVHAGNLEMWAEDGWINVRDERDDSIRTVSIRDMLERAQALSGYSKRFKSDAERRWYRHEILTRIEGIVCVCKEAREQRASLLTSSRPSQVLITANPID